MKLLLLALISFAMQVTATPTCDICSKGLKVVGGTGCYCGTGTKGTDSVAATAQTFVAATKYCDTTLNAATGAAYTTPKCAVTDGSTATATTCSCGTSNKQVLKTQFCYAGGDKTGKVSSAAKIVCTDTTGASKNPSTGKTCYCGSNSLDVSAGNFCSLKKDKTGQTTTILKCAGASLIDGSTAPTVSCACGDNGITIAITTEFCLVQTTGVGFKLTAKKCTKVDASVVEPTNCACGTDSQSATATTSYCFVKSDGLGKVSTRPRCTGNKANGVTKTTGTATSCDCASLGIPNDQYCYISGDTGYAHATKPWCSGVNADGSKIAAANCLCGTSKTEADGTTSVCLATGGAAGAGITYTNKIQCTGTSIDGSAKVTGATCNCGNTDKNAAAGSACYVKLDGTGHVTSAIQVLCTATDGTAKPTAQCYCGTGGAVTSTTQYCDITGNKYGYVRSKPRCTTNVATSKPAADCTCGTTGTGTGVASAGPVVTTAQFCFVTADGVGVMSAKAITAATTCDTTACTPSNNVAIVTACKCASGSTSNECAAAQYCWVGNTCNAKSNGANTAFHGLLAFAVAAFAASLIVV